MGDGSAYGSTCMTSPLTRILCACAAALVLLLLIARSAARAGVPTAARCDLNTYDAAIIELDLKDCSLTQLPASIARFSSLRKLDLGRNALTALPPLPPSLHTLFLLANAFESVPSAVRSEMDKGLDAGA